MRLKKLEIAGFKSFAERAKLTFGDGITGVVGPNGCGKSNIIDAIRWVMGEMSVKHLRGSNMQDVIFAGAKNRGPLGMAEVTLTFHNDGNVPPSYMNFPEIAVTRRLFRDGTSEYLLNKTAVRLRDITDLFLGTGVGTRAYSIIEQGRISFVVSARPEERRHLIEEVAGITRFKARKKAAERRMEATEQNLSRVSDVVQELERQLQSLRRQAKKAIRYKELRARLRDMELHTASLEVLRLRVLQAACVAQETAAMAQLNDAHSGLTADEASLAAERLRLAEEERRLTNEQTECAKADAALTAVERDLSHWQQKHTDLKQAHADASDEVTRAQQRRVELTEEASELEQQAKALEAVGQQDAGLFEEAQQAAQAAQQAVVDVDAALEAKRHEMMAHAQGLAMRRAHLTSLEKSRVDVLGRLAAGRNELDDLSPKQGAVGARAAELTARQTATEADLSRWQAELVTLRQREPQVVQAHKDALRNVAQKKDALFQKRSRLASLTEVAKRLEGYSDGVRTLLGGNNEARHPDLLGTVAEVISAPQAYERAVEAALGDRLQYVLTNRGDVAAQAIDRLLKMRGGRSGFILRDVLAATPPSLPAPPEGVAAPSVMARQIVSVTEGYEAVADALLGHVVITQDTDEAQRLAKQAAAPWVFVTPAGSVVEAAGAMAGGSADGAGLLASQREIRELKSVVEHLSAELTQVQTQTDALDRQKRELEDTSRRLSRDIHKAELERLATSKDAEAARRELARISERLQVLQKDQTTHVAALAQLDADEQEAMSAAKSAEAQQGDEQAQLAQLQGRRGLAAEALAARNESLTTVRVRLAALKEKRAASAAGKERVRVMLRELAEQEGRAAQRMADAVAGMAELTARSADGRSRAEQLARSAHAMHTALSAERAAYEAANLQVNEKEQAMKEARRGSESLLQTLTGHQMALQKLQMEERGLAAKVRERHDVDIFAIAGDYHLRALPSDAEHKERDALEQSIKAMGPVHLTAILECEEVNARHAFLVAQRDDLQNALEALKRAIARINRTSRERFSEAFDAVNAMFQKVYPRLFRGGVARLELTAADDILDAGVEIIAMPPGKKLQNVGLLSGGEKALTATALVFSIFLIKPSPFCVLDEVDAPLDEANVGRFNELLREISKFSQFIVITHNKQTMTQVDRLYGITMEEAGMSKVVAVDLSGGKSEEAA